MTRVLLQEYSGFLFCIIWSTIIAKLQIADQHGPIITMEAVEGKHVKLPCDLSSTNSADKVYMVFWFKENSGVPLYRVDVRGTSLANAYHESDDEVFGTRANFQIDSEPAALMVKDIRRHDQGMYRCRVDFRNSATRSFRYNLTIIVPPEKPIILDRYGQPLNDTLGPLTEGDDVVISCRVIGGNPKPEVRWLVNNKSVEDAFDLEAGDVIENKLSWPGVTRKDLNSVFTCQATNTNLTDPQESRVILDMRLRPMTLNLTTREKVLKANNRYEINCESSGSRPPAIITWYKNEKLIHEIMRKIVRENTSRSELSFTPSVDDDGKQLTCRAENPVVAGLFLESHLQINVIYVPIVTLRLGSSLKADNIKEGDDVYFECHVRANPPWKKLNWMHNGVLINQNSTARVIRSDHSLVLQRLMRHSAGIYTCTAANSEGENRSNDLIFRVKYAPTCRSEKTMVIGASAGESLEIVCEVDADPPVDSFRWKFNNSGETLDVGQERYSNNGSVSVLKYTPVADLDYGTLSCWAQNSIGMQTTPCVYQLVAAGKPHSLQNCTLSNQTSSSVEVKCHPGYDGGLPQVFVLEVYMQYSPVPVYNLTAKDYPVFHLSDLQSDVIFKILVSAVNSKGRSQAVVLEEFSFKDPEKRTADSLGIRNMSPVLGIVVGTLLGVILLIALILLNIWRSRNPPVRRRRTNNAEERKHDPMAATPIVSNHCDDINPDIIPAKYEPINVKRRNSHGLTTSNHTKPLKSSWDSDQISEGSILDPKLAFGKIHYQYEQSGNPFCHDDESESLIRGKPSMIIYKKEDDLNCTAIKETLMANRLPESCV